MPGDAGKDVATAESVILTDNKRSAEAALSGFGEKTFGEVLGEIRGEKIVGLCTRLLNTDDCTFPTVSFS
jgi:hypothetical protein